jgi:hypothetical protein
MPSLASVRAETVRRPSRQQPCYQVEQEGRPGDPYVYTVVSPSGARLYSFSSLRIAQDEAAVLNEELPSKQL